ncbi:hypothetical protein ES703_78666 [subsurface metagenome]|jgi:hypothetical protein
MVASRGFTEEISGFRVSSLPGCFSPKSICRSRESFSGGGACAQRRFNLGVILSVSKLLDCGIAMLHIAVAVLDCCKW